RGVDHLGQRRLDLEAEQEGVHERAAVRERQLAGREGRREDGRRGVAQHGEVGVVEVERVRGRAIGEGGPHGARASPRAHDGGEGRAAPAPRPALAQMFFSAKPDAPFTVGPLTVRATVTPALGLVDVSVLWSLDMPSGKSRGGIEQDLFLLWPGEISSPIDKKPNDKTL